MRGWFSPLLLLFLGMLAGCNRAPLPQNPWFAEEGKVKVLTTIAMIHDLVEEVGGEHVSSLPLIAGELNPHSYELVKGDDEKFVDADLIFYNGLGLEHGLSLRRQLEGNPKAHPVTVSLREKAPEKLLRVEGQYDPHVWMDIALWAYGVEVIVEALSLQDPAHASYYEERGEHLKEQLREADDALFAQLQSLPASARYLVTSHDAFRYFTRHYLAEPGEEEWEVRCRAPEGLAPDAQMSVADILSVLAHVERYGVTVLFPESNVNRDALKKIIDAAAHRGHALRLCEDPLYGDAMGGASSYLEMMQHNGQVIARELAGFSQVGGKDG